ncbi:MAG: galactose mutarotase [Lachnospiraceae bacterium]|nr:galactose mutarotase [Lachnospiraceae bacterium]
MGVTKKEFGKTKDRKQVYKYEIVNGKGMKAVVMNFGAILTELYVTDKNGVTKDVVLGYDTLRPYFKNSSFFGATVGPNANRIANASFDLNGIKYQLAVNDGKNNLHSDFKIGYHKRLFDASFDENSVTFTLKDPDGSMGFPGTKYISVKYSLTDDNELVIDYSATSDKETIINMTNHTYFNLCGHNSGRIEDHVLTINASNYTPVVKGAIPTGEIAPVENTVFDFRTPKRVGDHIDDKQEQLKLVKGYDHNWVLDNYDGSVRKIAEVTAKNSNLKMEVFTDLPGVQFYAGNCIGKTVGKDNTKYGVRCGLCLETQYYPDTANEPSFPSAQFGPSRKYETKTIYKFS